MNSQNLIIGIGAILIVFFLIFVFYSNSQWTFIDTRIPPESTEEDSTSTGQVSFTIIAQNETLLCNNNFDDDNDTFIDCEDSDCSNNYWCQDEEA